MPIRIPPNLLRSPCYFIKVRHMLNVWLHHTPNIGMNGCLEQRIVFRHVFALLESPAGRLPIQRRFGMGFGHASLARALGDVHISNEVLQVVLGFFLWLEFDACFKLVYLGTNKLMLMSYLK